MADTATSQMSNLGELQESSQTTGAVTDSPDTEDEDEDKVLEVSRNGRWQKNNQPVPRDVPGIDDAFLAMDTEEGVEVVWNEVRYSHSRKTLKGSKERLKNILQGLTDVKHQNIVNFHDFWHDKIGTQDRLVFITEYITSGSMEQFLKKTKGTKGTNSISDKIWRRWCRQILSALSYLHKNDIIHGNLSLASIFIQHNGLVKIGSVSPDAIHEHVKTKHTEQKGLHYTAPEYGEGAIQTSVDIYAFGICALEMLNLALLNNGEGTQRFRAKFDEALDKLEEHKRNFIRLCLHPDPSQRPKADVLLKHPVLQEVFNLKLLSAYCLRGHKTEIESHRDKLDFSSKQGDYILAWGPGGTFTAAQTSQIDIEKFFDDISQDFLLEPSVPVYSPQKKDDTGVRTIQPSIASSNDRNAVMNETETKRIFNVACELRSLKESKYELYLKLQFENKMDRELRSEIRKGDTAELLAFDLVSKGLLSSKDKNQVESCIATELERIINAPH